MSNHESDAWREAAKRVANRRDFDGHLVAYAVINGFLILIWAVTGADYFWPVWIMAGWGVGLVLHAYEVFVRRPVTDADIEAEMHRRRR